MLSLATKKVLLKIAKRLDRTGGSHRKFAREDPEAYLLSMLKLIAKELPEVSATLEFTIAMADLDEFIEQAKKEISMAGEEKIPAKA